MAGRARGKGTDEPLGFEGVLRHLRGLASSCEPPVGVGSFDLLYASEREVVVWYSPARDHHQPGEVAIPCTRLAAAWAALASGQAVDEAALEAWGGGVAGGRWLLALLAQLPGVAVRENPLALVWDPSRVTASVSAAPVATSAAPERSASGRGRRPRSAKA